MIVIGVIILLAGWFINKYSNSTGIFGERLKILWESEYLWFGVVTGGIFGFIKYKSCRGLGEVFTTCGTWSWTGVGYIVGAVVFLYNKSKAVLKNTAFYI